MSESGCCLVRNTGLPLADELADIADIVDSGRPTSPFCFASTDLGISHDVSKKLPNYR